MLLPGGDFVNLYLATPIREDISFGGLNLSFNKSEERLEGVR